MADVQDKQSRARGGLTPRQHRFALEYLTDLNATQACIRAGYSAKTAESAGSRLLRSVKVASFIAAKATKRAAKLEISAERTILEIGRLAYVDPRDFYKADGSLLNIHDMPEDARRALSGMETFEEFVGQGAERQAVGEVRKVKWHDKRAALDSLAKIQGLVTERHEVSVVEQAGEVSALEWEALGRLRHEVRKASPEPEPKGTDAP